MTDIMMLVVDNLEKIGIGVLLFLCAYLANMGLGAWNNVKIGGATFDWKLIVNSVVKFIVLGLSLALLSFVVSVIPAYATYVGVEIEAETLQTIDSIVIIGAFLAATIRYVTDAVGKVREILA